MGEMSPIPIPLRWGQPECTKAGTGARAGDTGWRRRRRREYGSEQAGGGGVRASFKLELGYGMDKGLSVRVEAA